MSDGTMCCCSVTSVAFALHGDGEAVELCSALDSVLDVAEVIAWLAGMCTGHGGARVESEAGGCDGESGSVAPTATDWWGLVCEAGSVC